MSTLAESFPRPTLLGIALAGLRMPLRAAARLVVAMRHRREVAGLLEADPGMLRDLGLHSADLNAALAEPFWRDPSQRLVNWSNERRLAGRAAARANLDGLAPAVPDDGA